MFLQKRVRLKNKNSGISSLANVEISSVSYDVSDNSVWQIKILPGGKIL